MKKYAFLAASLAALFAFTGCNESHELADPITPVDPAVYEHADKMDMGFSSHSLALQQANNCDDYRKHLLDSVARNIADIRFSAYYGGFKDVYENTAVPGAEYSTSSKDDSAPAGDYTTTNNQEAGADELDTVKNDGFNMYAVENGIVHITKVWPAEEMEEIATIKNSSDDNTRYFINGLLLDDNRLIVIESDYYWRSSINNFIVNVYDVTDAAHPKLIKKHIIDGYFTDARMIDHRLFIASSAYVDGDWSKLYELARVEIPGVPNFKERDYDDFKYDWDDDWSDDDWMAYWDEYNKKVEEWNREREANIEKYLPVIRAWVDKQYPTIQDFDWPQYSDGEKKKDALSCTDLYLPGTTSRESGLLMVSEISGSNFENFKANAVADDGWMVYASAKNFYLVSTSYNWWWDCDEYEKDCNGYSHIHHFSLGEKDGGLRYVNSGEVDGYVMDPFWMSDYDNHLRVVSSFSYGNSEKGHKLTVLDNLTPTTMKLTGFVEGFGKNEQLYSARMIGTRGYVVTYMNTDPLFTFDLSDHANPKLAGELKIPGYSSYIHPIGNTHLLTIGEDTTENGNNLGMKLELFDVSDISNPKSTAKILINQEKHTETGSSYGWSDALYDHHALNFHEASGLLAIPVNLESWHYAYSSYNWDYNYFSGMFVYRVTPSAGKNAFEFVGGVNHSPVIGNDNKYWWTTVDRARFYFKDKDVFDKNAYVYTVSRHGILANDANKPDTMIKSIKFAESSDNDFYSYYYYY